jgi:carboxyl-terminal processing protease
MNKQFLKDHFGPIAGIFVLTAALLAGGYYFGYSQGERAGSAATAVQGGEHIDADFNVFWEAWKKLRDNQVASASSTDQDLVYGAISGLAGSFGDPHTVFFPPEDATKFQEDVNGNFGGIGAEIGAESDVIAVVTPLKNSPAEKAGLRAGDLIVKINETRTDFMSVNKAVSLIRGTIGTPVTLSVFRKGWTQPHAITIVRDRIVAPTLDTKFLAGGSIMDIQLYAFNENAPGLFADAVSDFAEKGAKGIILDLRNNPGGYLEVASNLAGWFLPKDTLVVSERSNNGHEDPFLAQGTGELYKVPVIILINEGSASAAEILAGALRDQMGAKIVGEKSYGKGTVQELFPLQDDSSLKITVAHWVMPKGLVLDYNGIEPDVTVEISEEDIKAKKDPQLDKAVELLTAQIVAARTQAAR